jgi:hypothetical protein
MKILGPIAVLLGGIYLWSNGYQNGWIIAMIFMGTVGACNLD